MISLFTFLTLWLLVPLKREAKVEQDAAQS